MAVILNIETSARRCSIAVSSDGMIVYHIESDGEMDHAVRLAPFVEKALDDLARREMSIDAVAVSIGPGSYTGLRIGLSFAKGFCFARNLPLITLSTLEILAVKGMFSIREPEGGELLIPLIDARRMEVYTAAYDFALKEVLKPCAKILDKDSYSDLLSENICVFIGDGVEKAETVIDNPNARFASSSEPVALDMVALAEKKFREKDFADVAYAVPFYLKEYNATVSKNKVLENIR